MLCVVLTQRRACEQKDIYFIVVPLAERAPVQSGPAARVRNKCVALTLRVYSERCLSGCPVGGRIGRRCGLQPEHHRSVCVFATGQCCVCQGFCLRPQSELITRRPVAQITCVHFCGFIRLVRVWLGDRGGRNAMQRCLAVGVSPCRAQRS